MYQNFFYLNDSHVTWQRISDQPVHLTPHLFQAHLEKNSKHPFSFHHVHLSISNSAQTIELICMKFSITDLH